MSMRNPQQIYQQNAVTTATPAELTLMLYNGAIRFVRQSKQALEHKELEKAHQANVRAQDIINELMVTLNMDVDLSKQLLQLYDYLRNRLIEANVQKDGEILNEVEEFLIQFKVTWEQAMKLAKHPTASASSEK